MDPTVPNQTHLDPEQQRQREWESAAMELEHLTFISADYQKALELSQKQIDAEHACTTRSATRLGLAELIHGICLSGTGNYEEGDNQIPFAHALLSLTENGSKPALLLGITYLAQNHSTGGDRSWAGELFAEGEKLLQEILSTPSPDFERPLERLAEREFYLRRAEYFKDTFRPKLHLQDMQRAIASSEKLFGNSHAALLEPLQAIMASALEQDKLKLAFSASDRVISIATATQANPDYLVHGLSCKAQLLARMGSYASAGETVRRAIEIAERSFPDQAQLQDELRILEAHIDVFSLQEQGKRLMDKGLGSEGRLKYQEAAEICRAGVSRFGLEFGLRLTLLAHQAYDRVMNNPYRRKEIFVALKSSLDAFRSDEPDVVGLAYHQLAERLRGTSDLTVAQKVSTDAFNFVVRQPQIDRSLLGLLAMQHGVISLATRDGEKAEEWIRTAQDLLPRDSWKGKVALKLLLARSVAMQGRVEEALKYADQAIKEVPEKGHEASLAQAELLVFAVDCNWQLAVGEHGVMDLSDEQFKRVETMVGKARRLLEKDESWQEEVDLYANVLNREAILIMARAARIEHEPLRNSQYEVAEELLNKTVKLLEAHKREETMGFVETLSNWATCLKVLEYDDEFKQVLERAFLIAGKVAFEQMDISGEDLSGFESA